VGVIDGYQSGFCHLQVFPKQVLSRLETVIEFGADLLGNLLLNGLRCGIQASPPNSHHDGDRTADGQDEEADK
jgi:hypothetical protein